MLTRTIGAVVTFTLRQPQQMREEVKSALVPLLAAYRIAVEKVGILNLLEPLALLDEDNMTHLSYHGLS
jgi:hypothetical protein